MAQLWARIVNDVVVDLIPRPKANQVIHFDRLVNINGRPDLKVGSKWPFKTVDQALVDGDLERAPTEKDPFALRVPTKGAE